MGGPEGAAAADQPTHKAMDPAYKNHASERSRKGLGFANSDRPTANPWEENANLRENLKGLNRRHARALQQIRKLEEELTSKNLELSRGVNVPVPYGSYCSSGATPQLLASYSEKVLIDLGNFVLFSIPSETPIETVNAHKARVSDIFFSRFEQIDFGVKGESLFKTPGLLPEQSLTEFGAFFAYANDPEDEAVKSYMPKFERFFAYKLAKIEKTFGPVEFNNANYAHFYSLATNVWMLHKLALSFEMANVRLIRVVRDEPFIDKFMEPVGQQDEDQLKGKPPAATTTVQHVILPGLWVNNSVIKCRVCLGSATGQEPSTAPATQLREGDAVSGTGPRSVDATQDKAHQPTSSQVPDRKAPAANAQAHQQTQATEDRITDELHVSEASNSLLPDEDLGNDKTTAVEVDQTAEEMMNMDITNSPVEELESRRPPSPTLMSVSDNVDRSDGELISTSRADFAHHGNRPNPDPGSTYSNRIIAGGAGASDPGKQSAKSR